jgi:hypothetical protein
MGCYSRVLRGTQSARVSTPVALLQQAGNHCSLPADQNRSARPQTGNTRSDPKLPGPRPGRCAAGSRLRLDSRVVSMRPPRSPPARLSAVGRPPAAPAASLAVLPVPLSVPLLVPLPVPPLVPLPVPRPVPLLVPLPVPRPVPLLMPRPVPLLMPPPVPLPLSLAVPPPVVRLSLLLAPLPPVPRRPRERARKLPVPARSRGPHPADRSRLRSHQDRVWPYRRHRWRRDNWCHPGQNR